MKVGEYIRQLSQLDHKLDIYLDVDGVLYDIDEIQLVAEIGSDEVEELSLSDIDFDCPPALVLPDWLR